MSNLKDFPIGDNFPETVNVFIEIPKHSKMKYEYDVDLGVYKLDRVLHSSVHYPEAYGFIPSTFWDDGDPLDVMAIVTEPTFTGCFMEVRPIGVLRIIDDMGPDDKILAVFVNDPFYKNIFDISMMPKHYLDEIEHFFLSYKQLEFKKVESQGWFSSDEARKSIKLAHQKYIDLKNKK
jgi:inorganic pyrophosphatase